VDNLQLQLSMKYFVGILSTKIVVSNLSATFCVYNLPMKIFVEKLS